MSLSHHTDFHSSPQRSDKNAGNQEERQALLIASLMQDAHKAQQARRRRALWFAILSTLLFTAGLWTAVWWLQPTWTPNTWAGLFGLPLSWVGLVTTWFLPRMPS